MTNTLAAQPQSFDFDAAMEPHQQHTIEQNEHHDAKNEGAVDHHHHHHQHEVTPGEGPAPETHAHAPAPAHTMFRDSPAAMEAADVPTEAAVMEYAQQHAIAAPPDSAPQPRIVAPPPAQEGQEMGLQQAQQYDMYGQYHHNYDEQQRVQQHEQQNQAIQQNYMTEAPSPAENQQLSEQSHAAMAAASANNALDTAAQQTIEYAAAAVANMQVPQGGDIHHDHYHNYTNREYVAAMPQENNLVHMDSAKQFEQNEEAGLGVVAAPATLADLSNAHVSSIHPHEHAHAHAHSQGQGHHQDSGVDQMAINEAIQDEVAIAMNKATEDAVALAAMQEAAALVINAEQESKKRKAMAMDPVAPSQMMELKDPPPDSVPPVASAEVFSPPPKRRVPPTRISWEDRIQQLQNYKAQHGNLLIPIRFKENPSLGKFVHNTREQYKLFNKQTPAGYKKKCSLTPERIQQLDEIGFVWSTQRSKQQASEWQARYEQLERYKAEHGDCLVPHGYQADPSFAEWIHRQRTTYASMMKNVSKTNPMVKRRMEKLSNLGFNFTVHSDKWMDHWKLLKAYKDVHGDCQVPTHYADNPKLGRWVHTQRHQRRLLMKGKKSCMNEERIALLDELGFSWEVKPCLERPRATWQQRMDELTVYHQKHGNFLVSPQEMPHLYQWCVDQRQRLRVVDKNGGKDMSKRMGDDRIAALASIGFTKDADLMDTHSHSIPGHMDYHHQADPSLPSPLVHLDQAAAATAAATAAVGMEMHASVPNPTPDMVSVPAPLTHHNHHVQASHANPMDMSIPVPVPVTLNHLAQGQVAQHVTNQMHDHEYQHMLNHTQGGQAHMQHATDQMQGQVQQHLANQMQAQDQQHIQGHSQQHMQDHGQQHMQDHGQQHIQDHGQQRMQDHGQQHIQDHGQQHMQDHSQQHMENQMQDHCQQHIMHSEQDRMLHHMSNLHQVQDPGGASSLPEQALSSVVQGQEGIEPVPVNEMNDMREEEETENLLVRML